MTNKCDYIPTGLNEIACIVYHSRRLGYYYYHFYPAFGRIISVCERGDDESDANADDALYDTLLNFSDWCYDEDDNGEDAEYPEWELLSLSRFYLDKYLKYNFHPKVVDKLNSTKLW